VSVWFGQDLPWWSWLLLIIGAVSLVSVIGALFLPDWPEPDYHKGFGLDTGTDDFVQAAAGFLNLPVLRGGQATLLENGDAF
jgi:hypothetical protein